MSGPAAEWLLCRGSRGRFRTTLAQANLDLAGAMCMEADMYGTPELVGAEVCMLGRCKRAGISVITVLLSGFGLRAWRCPF